MSQTKLKALPTGDVISLESRRRPATGKFVLWGLVPVRGDESCRWETLDGRWVALALGSGDEIGNVVVTDSTGRRELVGSFEDALALAKHWRT